MVDLHTAYLLPAEEGPILDEVSRSLGIVGGTQSSG